MFRVGNMTAMGENDVNTNRSPTRALCYASFRVHNQEAVAHIDGRASNWL